VSNVTSDGVVSDGKISVVQLAAAKEAKADTADASLAAQQSPDRRRALYLSSETVRTPKDRCVMGN
jgi:hypothetical protein